MTRRGADLSRHRRARSRAKNAGAVEVTTRHACAGPLRLGSIPARCVRRRLAGTGRSTPPARPHPDAPSPVLALARFSAHGSRDARG